MMSEDLPLAASAADETMPARAAGGGRLATVRADFFLDSSQRLTEQERALMTAMLHCLVADVASELRARLPSAWSPANDQGQASLVDAVIAARLLDEAGLMALLLRRADEERIGAGARARTGKRDSRLLQGLVSHQDGEVAAAAMALILARGRRRDRFGQCLVSLDDCSAGSATLLVHAVAAAISRELGSDRPAEAVDQAIAEAATGLLSSRDPDRSVDRLGANLVDILSRLEQLDDALLLAAANEGEVALIAQGLAAASGLDPSTAFDELLSADPVRLALFLRSAGASRALAAGLLAALGDLLGIANPASAIDAFDRIGDGEAAAGRARLATAPAYRAALAALDRDHGQRPR